MVLEALKNDVTSLRFASESLRNDKGFMLAAVKKDGWALRFASE